MVIMSTFVSTKRNPTVEVSKGIFDSAFPSRPKRWEDYDFEKLNSLGERFLVIIRGAFIWGSNNGNEEQGDQFRYLG